VLTRGSRLVNRGLRNSWVGLIISLDSGRPLVQRRRHSSGVCPLPFPPPLKASTAPLLPPAAVDCRPLGPRESARGPPFAPPLRTGGLDARGRAGSAAVAVEGVAASERAQPCRANECAARPSTCDCRQTLPTQSSMMCWQSGPRAPRGHRRCPLAATVV